MRKEMNRRKNEYLTHSSHPYTNHLLRKEKVNMFAYLFRERETDSQTEKERQTEGQTARQTNNPLPPPRI